MFQGGGVLLGGGPPFLTSMKKGDSFWVCVCVCVFFPILRIAVLDDLKKAILGMSLFIPYSSFCCLLGTPGSPILPPGNQLKLPAPTGWITWMRVGALSYTNSTYPTGMKCRVYRVFL